MSYFEFSERWIKLIVFQFILPFSLKKFEILRQWRVKEMSISYTGIICILFVYFWWIFIILFTSRFIYSFYSSESKFLIVLFLFRWAKIKLPILDCFNYYWNFEKCIVRYCEMLLLFLKHVLRISAWVIRLNSEPPRKSRISIPLLIHFYG